ncbi:MAG TPA: hypothetical protein VEC35_09255 [Noviherbaspirillum sp.]|nr:hypothetical protein [Noviherbaspirillum sp.]
MLLRDALCSIGTANVEIDNCAREANLTTTEEALYEEDTYLFPMPRLLTYSNAELRDLIASNLDQAHDMTDGTDFNSDVKIDHAQDIIEQARDILLARGEVFTPEEQAQMDFLDWPLSPEEIAAQEVAEAREREARYLLDLEWSRIKNRYTPWIEQLIRGEALPSDAEFDGIELNIGWNGWTNSPDGRTTLRPSGEEVMRMRDELERVAGVPVELGHFGSRAGVTIETDPAPGWNFRFPVPRAAEAWSLLLQWWKEHRFTSQPEFWYRGNRQDNGLPFYVHWTVKAWPMSSDCTSWLYGRLGYPDFPWVRYHLRDQDGKWYLEDFNKNFLFANEWAAERLRLLEAGEELAYEITKLARVTDVKPDSDPFFQSSDHECVAPIYADELQEHGEARKVGWFARLIARFVKRNQPY